MADAVESDGPSADSALTFDDEWSDFDPAESAGSDNTQLAGVWGLSDQLRDLLTKRQTPDDKALFFLKAYLIRQLPTLYVYGEMSEFLAELKLSKAKSKTISLYILLFPGEARDNTGIKDLNDKVIGQFRNSQYLQKRYDAITAIFGRDEFIVAGGNYKTALILTYQKTRKDFIAKLALLDEELRKALLDILKQAAADGSTTKEQQGEIKKLSKKLGKKGYRFDIFFGLRTLAPQGNSGLSNMYLLVTEALKGAALARFVAKANTLQCVGAKDVAAQAGISPDAKKLDPRGKEYDWKVYIRASDLAEKIKAIMLKGQLPRATLELISIYVDTVWTSAFLEYKNLYWGNPDVIRDVRKKKLEPAPVKKGNVTFSFTVQKDLLELWLVILNMLDYIKGFKSEEFSNQLKSYHDKALRAYIQLGTPGPGVDWDNLTYVLTHDVQQTNPIAINGTGSEFQFYCTVSDYRQRIFFSMDVRDLGVELMLDYEVSNREVGYHKYSDTDLMYETFRSSDPIDARRRLTYETVVAVFQKYYRHLAKSPGAAFREATRAFGGGADDKLGSFAESVQVMLGGDEVYVATHPQFAQYVPAIIGELTPGPYVENGTLDMRASVCYSKAQDTDAANQRAATQRSHQEAMKLAELATGTLKSLERTDRRIERLVDMIEANPKKKPRGAGYRTELAKLALRSLFARVKYGWPQQLPKQDYGRLYAALLAEDLGAAERGRFELVDFTGKVVDIDKLEKDAAALETKVRQDVGTDNARVQPMPVVALPKWVQALLDKLLPKKP